MSLYDHPKWQKRRLEIMQRDGFRCLRCGADDVTLNVHHRRYITGRKIWEYDDEDLGTFCQPCHETIHGLRDVVHSTPTVLAHLLPQTTHGYFFLLPEGWRCSCGCGHVMTSQQFKMGTPNPLPPERQVNRDP